MRWTLKGKSPFREGPQDGTREVPYVFMAQGQSGSSMGLGVGSEDRRI